jgi:hypothetical protein
VSPRTLGKDTVSVTRRRNGCFSLPSALWHSAKRFAECPIKSTRHRRLCRCTVCRALFAECDTRQRLCRVLRELGKAVDSGSAGLRYGLHLNPFKQVEFKYKQIIYVPIYIPIVVLALAHYTVTSLIIGRLWKSHVRFREKIDSEQ